MILGVDVGAPSLGIREGIEIYSEQNVNSSSAAPSLLPPLPVDEIMLVRISYQMRYQGRGHR